MAHKKIDFTELGGFPATQNTFDFMQNAYNDAIAGLARAVGEKVIVSGVEENNSQVTDGWVVINGELLPFKGGAIQSHVVIVETSKSVVFDNPATSKEVYFDRVVKFGSGLGQIPWSDFKRVGTLESHLARIETLEDKILLTGRLDFGVINAGSQMKSVTHNLFTNKGLTPQDYMIIINISQTGGLGEAVTIGNITYGVIKGDDGFGAIVTNISETDDYIRLYYTIIKL